MSVEMDIEIRKLPVEDLVHGLGNLAVMGLQLGESVSPEESRKINEAWKKLSGFVYEKIIASMREENPIQNSTS